MVGVVLSVGALLPLLSRSPEAAMASAIFFGGSFLSMVTAVTAVARYSLQPHHWTPAIAGLTVAFALGQCLGPVPPPVCFPTGPQALSWGSACRSGYSLPGHLLRSPSDTAMHPRA